MLISERVAFAPTVYPDSMWLGYDSQSYVLASFLLISQGFLEKLSFIFEIKKKMTFL